MKIVDTQSEAYRKVHFAVMAIEGSAQKKTDFRERNASPFEATGPDTPSLISLLRTVAYTKFGLGRGRYYRDFTELGT